MSAVPTSPAPVEDSSVSARPALDSPAEVSSSKRVLEPIERISEVLFGLIMVLTFTCSLSVAESGRAEIRSMLIGALGCNLAWGLIDGIMYLMGCLAEKARHLAAFRAVRAANDTAKAHQLLAENLPPPIADALDKQQLDQIRVYLQQLPEPVAHPTLGKKDWMGAIAVFFLVVVSTIPVVLPFALMANTYWAQRVSNLVAIGLLFLTGYCFGRCTGYHPKATGIAMVAIGGVLVGLTILLGG